MTTYNSKRHGRKKFNALRYAGIKDFIARPVKRLYPMRGSGMEGWSQIDSDPETFLRDRDQKTLAEVYIHGCNGEPVTKTDANGEVTTVKNPDGTIKRNCRNRACGGTFQGVAANPSSINIPAAQIMGIHIQPGDSGTLHYEGDKCEGHHYGTSPARNLPTAAEYADLPIIYQGHEGEELTINELLMNANTAPLGTDEEGRTLFAGSMGVDKRTGAELREEPIKRIGTAAMNNATAMTRLAEQGVTDVEPYWQAALDTAHQEYRTKEREVVPGSDSERLVGVSESAPERLPLHTVTNRSFQNVRNSPMVQLNIAELHRRGTEDPCTRDESCKGCHSMRRGRMLWDKLKTSSFVQAFTPHHAWDETAEPMNHVYDVQDLEQLARSKDPAVQSAYFHAFPDYLPSVDKNMSELGAVGKKAPVGSFWNSLSVRNLIQDAVTDIQRRKKKRYVGREPVWQPEYEPGIDMDALRQKAETPENFQSVQEFEKY